MSGSHDDSGTDRASLEKPSRDSFASAKQPTLTFKLLTITLTAVLASLAGMVQVIINQKVGPEMLAIV